MKRYDNWFEKLVGFEEIYEEVRNNIQIKDNKLVSKINKKEYFFGEFELASLGDLKKEINISHSDDVNLKISNIVDDIQNIHKDFRNNESVIQVASQFNCLEMIDPYVIPEDGVTIYEDDLTQGPACSIACGAGTIYRNYFVKLNNQIGQTFEKQINCLEEIEIILENSKYGFWKMQNGYLLSDENKLKLLNEKLISIDENSLENALKVGVQWNTEVTLGYSSNLVTQVFCSALPVSYSECNVSLWEKFARLILEATYEITFYIALKNYQKTGKNRLYLTLVGGGAFGNKKEWIFDAIEKALYKFKNSDLDVKIVSYRYDLEVVEFVEKMNRELKGIG